MVLFQVALVGLAFAAHGASTVAQPLHAALVFAPTRRSSLLRSRVARSARQPSVT
jgi:hypothetical protein